MNLADLSRISQRVRFGTCGNQSIESRDLLRCNPIFSKHVCSLITALILGPAELDWFKALNEQIRLLSLARIEVSVSLLDADDCCSPFINRSNESKRKRKGEKEIMIDRVSADEDVSLKGSYQFLDEWKEAHLHVECMNLSSSTLATDHKWVYCRFTVKIN